jgi:proline iminopeptidase
MLPSLRCLPLLAAVLSGCAAPPLPAAPAPLRLPVQEGYLATDDSVRLFFRVEGQGDTVVVVHGGPGFSMNYLHPDLAQLAAHHTLIYYDQRNAGRSSLVSDSTRLEPTDYVRDLDRVRTHFGLERLTLLGHSWGGLLAGLYAIAHPDRVERMILVASSEPTAAYDSLFRPTARIDTALVRVMRGHNLALRNSSRTDSTKVCWDYYAIFSRGYFQAAGQERRLWGDVCNVPPATITNRLRHRVRRALGDYDIQPQLAAVRAPTLLIHGEHDPIPIFTAELWARALPDAQLLRMHTGHFPHVDRPDLFFPAVESFLRGERPDTAALKRVPAVAPQSPHAVLRAEIAAVEKQLVEAMNRGDWQAAAEVYSTDALVFAPAAPPLRGRRAIAAFWQAAHGRGLRTVDLQLVDVEQQGEVVLALGKYTIGGPGGQTIDLGKFLAVYRREGSEWRLYRDVFNSSMETRSPLEVPDYLSLPGR